MEFEIKELLVPHWEYDQPSLVFGRLMDKAVEVQEAFRSDWYHDAIEISKLVPDTKEFYFCIGQCGTNITTSPSNARMYFEHGRHSVFLVKSATTDELRERRLRENP